MDAGLETVVAIETPEQIALEVEIAGIGSRFVAYALDILWQSVILVCAFVAAMIIARAQGVELTSKNPEDLFLTRWAVALISLTFFIVNFGYFTLFEMLWRGQTPGKRRVKLRIIREGGYPLTFAASFLRNLLRIVDFLPVGYAVGVTAAVLGSRWQRLGDLAARTWVVREHPENGRKGLFVNPQFTQSIFGLSKHESAAVLDMLYRHCQQPELTCRFRWRPGSVAFWDNRATLHYALDDYGDALRVAHRVTLRGDVPFGPAMPRR